MRLTAVQRDVIERLKDGWELYWDWVCTLRKTGEASRHVRTQTAEALIRQGIIVPVLGSDKKRWVLADGADA